MSRARIFAAAKVSKREIMKIHTLSWVWKRLLDDMLTGYTRSRLQRRLLRTRFLGGQTERVRSGLWGIVSGVRPVVPHSFPTTCPTTIPPSAQQTCCSCTWRFVRNVLTAATCHNHSHNRLGACTGRLPDFGVPLAPDALQRNSTIPDDKATALHVKASFPLLQLNQHRNRRIHHRSSFVGTST